MCFPGVIDEKLNLVGARSSRGDLVWFGDVETECFDTRVFDRRRIPGAGVHLARAACQEFSRKRQTDSAVRTGDESYSVSDLHGETPGRTVHNLRGITPDRIVVWY